MIGINRTFVLLHLIFLFSSAGRALGIDGFLHRKLPIQNCFDLCFLRVERESTLCRSHDFTLCYDPSDSAIAQRETAMTIV